MHPLKATVNPMLTGQTPASPVHLRVLVCAETFLPAMNGVTGSVIRVLEHLDACGHEALVVAPGPGPDHLVLDSGSIIEIERTTALRPPMYSQLTVGLATQKFLAEIVDRFKPDVVHLAAPTLLGRQLSRVLSRRDIATVALFQTDLSGFAANYGAGFADRAIWAWLRQIHNQADITLAPTPGIAKELLLQRFSRVGVWGRGVDHKQFNPQRRSEAFRKACAVKEGQKLVGFIGRLAAEKQIDRLVSITNLKDVKLVIVGEGPERERLEALLPAAHFTGFKSGEQLGEAMASLDVFIHTGPHETYCQTVQEAMAANVAVIAPNSGGPADLISNGVNGLLFEPNRPQSLRAHLVSLIKKPELREQIAASGHDFVKDRSWAALGDQLLAHYRRAIALHRPVEELSKMFISQTSSFQKAQKFPDTSRDKTLARSGFEMPQSVRGMSVR